MRKIRIFILTFLILTNLILFSGCWNYREVDDFQIVAGVAVDKGKNNNYEITVEIADVKSGRDMNVTSKIIRTDGKTLFDTARNMISLSGKKLYWSHTKVIILSREIASEGINKIIDWYNRDAETRTEVYMLISQGNTAREILGQGNVDDIHSYILSQIMDNEKNLSKAPVTDILKFDIESKSKGKSTVLPVVKLKQKDKEMVPEVTGSAIIKNNKLAGFLTGEETKDLMFIRDEIKSGVLNEEIKEKDKLTKVGLEIFKNKTKIKPVVNGNNISMDLDIETTAAIDDIEGPGSFLDEEGILKLEQSTENTINQRIGYLIRKMQSEYDADIFGFGAKLWENEPKAWKGISSNWDEVFKYLKVNIRTKVNIKNSAILSKSLSEGENK